MTEQNLHKEPGNIRKDAKLPKRFRILIIGAILGLLSLAAIGAYWINSLNIEKLVVPILAPTQLIDKNGKPSSQIISVKIESVSLDQIPMHVRQAIVAVEDKRFYEHTGVDAFGIIRAVFRNVKEGGAAQGGSTITQQLAKNVFLSGKKTFSRKLTEAAYALKIESSYSKDQILEMYLNQIYFGEGQWGIQKAAKRYFGKDTKDLTLAEGALLAALPKAPSRYSPLKNKELALERRNLVLGLMRDEGFISPAEYGQAIVEPIQVLKKAAPELENRLLGQYASYTDEVIDEAIELYGFTERQLLAGNLLIYTELDPAVQNAMEETYRNDSLFPISAPDQLVQSGAVILDPSTGGVRGIVGQRGEHVFRGFNHATQLVRQPGSAFKPLMVYAPALEKGYDAKSMLYDGPLDIKGYKPENSDHRTLGQVSLRDAVIHSRNIPAVWLLNEIGLETGKTFVEKLGIPLAEEDNNLSSALGGLSQGLSPLQMAQGYSVFPNLGAEVQAHTITKITTADGRVLAEADFQSNSIMSPENAHAMTELLRDVVREGTGKNAAMDRPVAGKTGTTQLPQNKQFAGITGGAKDAWFVGYTPELVGAVWLGYDNTDSKHYLTTSGGQYPALIFKEMMSLALKGVPVSEFKLPATGKLDKGNNGKEDKKEKKQNDKKDKKDKKEKEKKDKKDKQKDKKDKKNKQDEQ
ncbi:PBP1A family penicillin-binding protein [Cohnella endophytica]|uniref:PBP1A family penicillin-binding protein n=1 Tax=Cohnella endophytica TaxID=2419778 RepID=A0A494XTU5_9BACL|nr:PBP1A family penicillin-binding protein [Cohnella endophytica]RKP51519.1 PBP1A family penicillin-binding protein [Cohnella endophytica]